MRTKRLRLLALLIPLALIAAACGGDDDDSSSGNTTTTGGDGGSSGAYAVNTDDCPDDATATLGDTIKIGSTMPLSGGVAAVAFAPVAEGLKDYIAYANDNDLVKGH
jgi:ABC-type branched-subunit amino acid transport system substrate-binding protein